MAPECCKMKGMLTFMVLWLVHQGFKTGAQITGEIEKRRGTKPSPGTIYPVLKNLREKGLLEGEKEHTLTAQGEAELKDARHEFQTIFYDMDEICRDCQ